MSNPLTNGRPGGDREPRFHELREPGSGKLLGLYDPRERELELKRSHGGGPVRFSLGELDRQLTDGSDFGVE